MSQKGKGLKRKLDFKKKALRTYFLHIKESGKKGEISKLQKEILDQGMIYLQMRLPINIIFFTLKSVRQQKKTLQP
jgi:hypothetical protein